ncbi:hypothetical protein [uncultured Aquimarina sp.]|uniref:hypothetical protein n=1 Tax=uncultured Aquimarina sp. TaxID=575652 RepID=UPI0026023768|nr:hypothetical protein [uncultured Aquimarina sp.]
MQHTKFTYEEAVTKIKALGGKPIAVEAQWDGDTQGWFLMMFVIITIKKGVFQASKTEVHHLGNLSLGSDLRVFNGTVPPYPEARVATEIGEKLAKKYKLEFFFPSPIDPDDDCPRWTEKEKAISCVDCNKLIIPTDNLHRPKNICYNCNLTREQNKRIKDNEPYDGGVTMYLYKNEVYENIGYCTHFKDFTIAPFIGHLVTPNDFKQGINVITLEKEDIIALKEKLEEALSQQLSSYKKPIIEEHLKKIKTVSKVTYNGTEYELMDRFNASHSQISDLISSFDTTDKALQEGYSYKIHFKKGITHRDDAMFRFINYVEKGKTNIERIQERFSKILTKEEISNTIDKLDAIGWISIDDPEVLVTILGKNSI